MQKVIKYCLLFSGTGAQDKGSYKITVTEIDRIKKKEKFLLGGGTEDIYRRDILFINSILLTISTEYLGAIPVMQIPTQYRNL